MRTTLQQIMLLAAVAVPVLAIEPPTKVVPIQPGEPVPAVPLAEVPKAVPMAEVVESRPYLGVIIGPVPGLLASHLKLAAGQGVVVGDMVTGGPADSAGLAVNDLIVRINGNPVGSAEEVRDEVEASAIGEQIRLSCIHEGEPKDLVVTLGEAPQMPVFEGALRRGLAGGDDALDGMLQDLPDKHADLIREALEENMKAFEHLDLQAGIDGQEQHRELLKRMQRRFKGEGGQIDFDAASSIRLLDDEGSIEMKTSGGSKVARVFDKAGNLLWEGSYDTDQDKAAVPEEIKERLNAMNFDMEIGGKGMRLRMGPERFRNLDEIEPAAEAPAQD